MNLATLRRLALGLPDVREAPHHQLTSFRVRGRIFATAPRTGGHAHLFVDETTRERSLALYPAFVDRLLWGGKVVGLRVALADAPPRVVTGLVRAAWQHKAPPAPRARNSSKGLAPDAP
jgi:hypothetical protein